MNFDVYALSAKALVGEQLSDEEKSKLQNYNTKYALVRYLVAEKQRHSGVNLADFHFTPGTGFLETPALDVANEIIKSFSLPATPIRFDDLKWEDNPPHSGKVKRTLVD
jgi:hypothetical protein